MIVMAGFIFVIESEKVVRILLIANGFYSSYIGPGGRTRFGVTVGFPESIKGGGTVGRLQCG